MNLLKKKKLSKYFYNAKKVKIKFYRRLRINSNFFKSKFLSRFRDVNLKNKVKYKRLIKKSWWTKNVFSLVKKKKNPIK